MLTFQLGGRRKTIGNRKLGSGLKYETENEPELGGGGGLTT